MAPVRSRARALVSCLVLASLAHCAATVQAAEEQPFILPRPKQMQLAGRRLPLVRAGRPVAALVLGKAPCRQAEIGADEINQRLKDICGVALPVKREEAFAAGDADAPALLVLGRPGENALLARECAAAGCNLTPTAPGPQGYVIRFVTRGGRRLVLVGGCDRVGLLYACVTLRYFITGDATEAKGCAVREANVRDWPDVRWRFTWSTLRDWRRIATGWDGRHPPARPREGVAAARAGIDWLLRHKINVFNMGHAGRRQHADQLRECYRQVLHYAFERGVWGYTAAAHGNLAHVPVSEAKPEHKACFSYERGGQLSCWCWSRDEAMARRFDQNARDIAALLPSRAPDTGGLFVYLHTPDTGNMGWHKRCARCRQRFGNDQAAAQANLFNHFHRAVKKHIPRSKLVFVPRPYVGFNMDHPPNQVYRDRLAALAKALPPHTYLVHTQTSREAAASWKRLTPTLHLAHWVNGTSQWVDFYFRLNRTYALDPEDLILQGGPYDWWALEVLGAAETMWNTAAPGTVVVAEDPKQPYELRRWFDEADTPADLGKHQAAFSKQMVGDVPMAEWLWLPAEKKAGPELMAFLERVAVHVYGEQAGALMLRVAAAGFMERYLSDPLAYATRGYATPEVMASQARAYEQAAAAAEELWAKRVPLKPGVFAGGGAVPGLTRPAHRFGIGVHHVMQFHTRLAEARVWCHILSARQALERGEAERAARSVDAAAHTLDAQAAELRSVHARLDRAKRYRAEVRPQMLEAALAQLERLRPKVETARIEVTLKQAIRRFAPSPFRPHYQGGKMRVAVYAPPPKLGRVPGAQGICATLAGDPEIDVRPIHSLALGLLRQHDVLVVPSCSQMPPADLRRLADLRRYVGDFGGGIYLQHVSVGHRRFPLHDSLFPEIGRCAERVDSNRVRVAAAHPLVGGHRVGEIAEHMYYDHMTLDLRGGSGTAVLADADSGAAVVAVGQVGRGRVVLDGTIALASSRTRAGKALAAELGKDGDFEHPAFGISRDLLLHGIRWLCGKAPREGDTH